MAQPSVGIKLEWDTLRSVDSATFDGATWMKVGAVLANPVVIAKFKNLSSVTVSLSYDGTNAHDIFPAGGGDVNDITANAPTWGGSRLLYLPAGTQIYAKGAAGTGLFYIAIATAGN